MYLGNLVLDIMLVLAAVPALLYLTVYAAVYAYGQAVLDIGQKQERARGRWQEECLNKTIRNTNPSRND